MSIYSRQNLVMPKITKSLTMKRRSLDEQKFNSGKDFNNNLDKNKELINVKFNLDNPKKPGTSIEKVKPNNIFPKIIPMKMPAAMLYEDETTTHINNKINIHKKLLQEINKEEHINFHKSNTINNNNNKNLSVPKVIKHDSIEEKDKEKIEEKKLINKVVIDINKYKDICINILTNNSDLNKIFSEIYSNKINCKKWVENNLFGREIFKVRLEAYIKNKTDVLSFIKSEIEKILNNEYCDYLFNKSSKQIEDQYNEHMKYIESF